MDMGFRIFGEAALRTDRHKLAGTVQIDGVPAKRIVVILHRYTMTVVASTMSDPEDGTWRVKNIPEYPEQSLLVLATDNTGSYNAEVADYISQVL